MATLRDYDPLALPHYEILEQFPQAQQTGAGKTGRSFSTRHSNLGSQRVNYSSVEQAEAKTSWQINCKLHDEAQGYSYGTSIADAANDDGFTPACSSGAVSSRWVSEMRARQLKAYKSAVTCGR